MAKKNDFKERNLKEKCIKYIKKNTGVISQVLLHFSS